MSDPISLFVSPVVNKVIEIITSFIHEEFLLVCGVYDAVENLSSNLNAIRAVLNDAEEKQLGDRSLRDWLAKLKDAAYDAEDVLDAFATETFAWKRKQNLHSRFWPPLRPSEFSFKYDVAHKVKEISERLDTIAKERHNFQLSTSDFDAGSLQGHPLTDFVVDPTNVFGREKDKEDIVNLLLSENSDAEGNVSVIPIFGMGGIGKTTLAQLVFNDNRVDQLFTVAKMWVCVTVDFNMTRILREIMESYEKVKLSPDITDRQMESRFRDFMSGKRFFIVLDDVWTQEYVKDWEPLLQLLQLGSKGSKVLVTTRNLAVSNAVGTQPPCHLGLLSEEDGWLLFEKMAFKRDFLPGHLRSNLEAIGKQIVAKCQGLPLAVKAMGGLLRGNVNEEKWTRILASDTWQLEDQNSITNTPKILPALKLSYNHLPSHLKQLFAFCSIFPKAYVINKRDMVKLWMAQAFVQSRGQVSAEDVAAEYFDDLLVRSFFQPLKIGDEKQCRMHDLIHDLAQSISSPYCCLVNDSKSCRCPDNCRHVSVLCQDVEQPCLEMADHSKKLRTFLAPSGYLKNFGLALDKLFRSLRYIRTLDLSSSTLLELPSSIEELKLLRYLDLSKTEIKELPNTVCNLYNLQTLKLLGCLWLFKLPNDLSKLVNLEFLELDDMFWFKCTSLPPKLGNLTRLRDLHAFKVGRQRGYQIVELKHMEFLTGALHISNLENAVNVAEANLNGKERLQKVVLEWTSRDVNVQDQAKEEKVLKDLQPHHNLKELHISHYKASNFPHWIRDGTLHNLSTLSFNHCTKCKVLTIGSLPHLQQLTLKGLLELEEWPDVPYFSLRRLKISNCPKLIKLPTFFPNIRVLRIKRCNSLKALPITPSLTFLKLVDNIDMDDWQEEEIPCQFRNDQGQLVAGVSPSFHMLIEMTVINCPKLQGLPPIFAPQRLEIRNCQLMTTLPAPNFARRFLHLAMDQCNDGALLRALPRTDSLYSLVISNVSNVITLPRWPHLPGLKVLYIHNCKDLVSLTESEEEESFPSLTSLKLLSIQGCEKLVTLPKRLPAELECLRVGLCTDLRSLGCRETLKSLNSLTDLYVEECPLLEFFPQEGLPTSLQHLCVRKCPLLAKQCQKEVGPEWQKIKDIPDLEIDNNEAPSPQLLSKKRSWFQRTMLERTKFNKQTSEVFLEHRRKKKWVDEKSGHDCFLLYARSLLIAHANYPRFSHASVGIDPGYLDNDARSVALGGDPKYWSWKYFKETSDENIEVARLRTVCWLEIRGAFSITDVPPGIEYEVLYVMKLTRGAEGWEFPITLCLSLTGGEEHRRQITLLEKPRGEWLEIIVGSFTRKDEETTGHVSFQFLQKDGHWKLGLVVKGVIIRPKHPGLSEF